MLWGGSRGRAMTEEEWLVSEDPQPMLEAIGDHASARKLYLVGLACTRRLFKLKPEGVAAMAAFEGALEDPDLDAAVRTLHPAFPRFGFDRRPLNWALGSANGPSGYKGKQKSPPLIRDIFGNPFRPVTFSPAWRTDTTPLRVARQIATRRGSSPRDAHSGRRAARRRVRQRGRAEPLPATGRARPWVLGRGFGAGEGVTSKSNRWVGSSPKPRRVQQDHHGPGRSRPLRSAGAIDGAWRPRRHRL